MHDTNNESKLDSLSDRLRTVLEKVEIEQARMAEKLNMSPEDLEKLRQDLNAKFRTA